MQILEEELSNFFVNENGDLMGKLGFKIFIVTGIKDDCSFILKPVENE